MVGGHSVALLAEPTNWREATALGGHLLCPRQALVLAIRAIDKATRVAKGAGNGEAAAVRESGARVAGAGGREPWHRGAARQGRATQGSGGSVGLLTPRESPRVTARGGNSSNAALQGSRLPRCARRKRGGMPADTSLPP